MSIVSSPVAATLTTTERTWRATIETPFGQEYSLTIHREKRTADADGNQLGEPVVSSPLSFRFDDIAAQSFTVDGVTLTVTQLSAFLQHAFDVLATT